MNVVFTVQHPAHVHLFKNAIRELGDEATVRVFARENDIASHLLEAYDITYTGLAPRADSFLELAGVQALYESRLLWHCLRDRPDVMVAMCEPGVAHVSKLVGAKSLVLTDTEHASLQNRLTFPFADRILTPHCYRDDIGPKQHRYHGYHELAYLHPARFTPDPSVLDGIDATPDEKIVVLRLVSWGAAHDVGNGGFVDVAEAVAALEATGARVLITAEAGLPAELADYEVSVEPHRIHHLLACADLFVGEGATMAAESAVLGVPSVYINTLSMGYTEELRDRYGLLFSYSGRARQRRGIDKATSILESYDAETWRTRRERLLSEKTDTTAVILDHIEELYARPEARAPNR